MSGLACNYRVIVKDLCLPFTIGYHVEETTNRRKIKRQDGFIAGWVFLTLLLAVATTLSVGHWVTTYWSKSIDKPSLQICGSVLQLLCCAFILPTLCNNRIRGLVSSESSERSDTTTGHTRHSTCRQWTKKVLPLIGITIFLTGMITLDIMKVAAYSFCIDEYQEFEEYPYLLKEAIVAVIYHPIRILFTSMVTVLCFMYIRKELCFYRYCYLRHMLLLVMAGVAWIWLDTQLTESLEGHVTEDAYSTGTYKTDCPPNSSMEHMHNYTQIQCLCKATDLFGKVNSASEILYSFVVEYCLLVIECLMHMLFSMAEKSAHSDDAAALPIDESQRIEGDTRESEVVGGESEVAPLVTRYGSFEEPYRYHMQNVAWMDSYEARRSDSSLTSDPDPVLEASESTENSFPSNRLTYFFVSLILGLLFVILTAMQTFASAVATRSFKVTYYTFKLVYHILAVGMTLRGFKACKHFQSKHRGYMGFEMLTLFASFGFFVYVFFILLANIAELQGAQTVSLKPDIPHSYRPAIIVYMMDLIMNTIQVYSQSLFMFHSSKIKPPADRSTVSKEAVYLFKQVLLYLATCNFFIWGLESFVELQNISEILPFHSVYYGEANWQMISHMAYPLMIFYRFNSCIYLIGVYLST